MDSSQRKRAPSSALFDTKIVVPAIGSAFVKLDPRKLMTNPVMFVLEIVTILTTIILLRDLFTGSAQFGFEFQIVLWLWFTVLFANLAEALAEGRSQFDGRARLIAADGEVRTVQLGIAFPDEDDQFGRVVVSMVDLTEREHIQQVLADSTTLEEAAAHLGINPTTLWRKRRRYGLE